MKFEKQKTTAFGKDIYYLGKDTTTGENYWLEGATWDCNWYWGFGYVETYTNNNDPSRARDISSHSHFEGVWFKQEDRRYYHILSDRPGFETPLSKDDQWKLSEYMRTFYTLKEAAEVFGRGNSYLVTSKEYIKKADWCKEINEVLLPDLFKRIYALLETNT